MKTDLQLGGWNREVRISNANPDCYYLLPIWLGFQPLPAGDNDHDTLPETNIAPE